MKTSAELGVDWKAISRKRIFGIGFLVAAALLGSRKVQIAPPTKAKPSSSKPEMKTQPGTEPSRGRVRKAPGPAGGAVMFERLGGIRYDPAVIGVSGTAGGTVGERVVVGLGLDPPGLLRGVLMLEREGLTEAVARRAARAVWAACGSPPASTGNKTRMV